MTLRLTEEEFQKVLDAPEPTSIDYVVRCFETGDEEELQVGEDEEREDAPNGLYTSILKDIRERIPRRTYTLLVVAAQQYYNGKPPWQEIHSEKIIELLKPFIGLGWLIDRDYCLWEDWACGTLEPSTYEEYVLWFDDFHNAKGTDEVTDE